MSFSSWELKEDLARYERLIPASRIVRLAIEREEDGLTVSLVFRPEGARGTRELVFRGAREVRFPSEEVDLLEPVELQIADIGDRGWEGIRFHVQDVADERLSLLARSYEERDVPDR